jgi:hypothetical protein
MKNISWLVLRCFGVLAPVLMHGIRSHEAA